MTQPTEELIIWANTDVNLPKLAGPNKKKPTDDLINKGWDFTEKPTADEFNYILNNMGKWINWAITNIVDGSANINMTTIDTVSVTNIRLGTEVTFQISNATGTSQYAVGYVLVGATNDGNSEVDIIHTRPLQQYINGVWYTIGNI